jgi:hypothetical protein
MGRKGKGKKKAQKDDSVKCPKPVGEQLDLWPDDEAADPEVAKRALEKRIAGSVEKSRDCALCGKPAATARCTRCKSVVYCDRECQKSHWKAHKKICGQAELVAHEPQSHEREDAQKKTREEAQKTKGEMEEAVHAKAIQKRREQVLSKRSIEELKQKDEVRLDLKDIDMEDTASLDMLKSVLGNSLLMPMKQSLEAAPDPFEVNAKEYLAGGGEHYKGAQLKPEKAVLKSMFDSDTTMLRALSTGKAKQLLKSEGNKGVLRNGLDFKTEHFLKPYFLCRQTASELLPYAGDLEDAIHRVGVLKGNLENVMPRLKDGTLNWMDALCIVASDGRGGSALGENDAISKILHMFRTDDNSPAAQKKLEALHDRVITPIFNSMWVMSFETWFPYVGKRIGMLEEKLKEVDEMIASREAKKERRKLKKKSSK